MEKTTNSPYIKCNIKYNTWVDYTFIGPLPPSFNNLIKSISTIVFPFNFCISYFREDLSLIPIDNSTTYKNFFNYLTDNSITEVFLFVMLYEDEPVRTDKKIISQKRIKEFIPVCQTISETEEYSSSSSVDGENLNKNYALKKKRKNNDESIFCY